MQRAVKGSLHQRSRSAFIRFFLERAGSARAAFPKPVLYGRWLRFLAIFLIVVEASQVHARVLNIGGSLSVNYNRSTSFSKTDFGNTSTTVNSIGQRYSGEVFGDYYRLGNYRADVSWTEQDVHLVDADQKNRFNVTDYRLTVGLFPQWSPLNLSRERILRKTDLESGGLSLTTKDRVDSLGANWVIHTTRLPALVLNYQQSQLKSDSGENFITRSASAYSDTTIGFTRISAGYQFSETDSSSSGPTKSHGVNLDTNSQLTTSLTFVAFGHYTNTHLPEGAVVSQTTTGVSTPGVSFFQERSYGASLIYRPPLYWWDGMVGYNYSENPFFNDFKSQAVQGSANLRYNEKTDSSFGARYLQFLITDSTVNSESADASLNYRPFFGLTTGLNGTAGLTSTRTTGAENTDNTFQHYQYNINYTRPWELVQYRAAYQIGYGVSDTQPTGFNSRDLENSISLGVDNTNTQIIHLSLNTSYSDIQRITESVRTEQTTYLIQVSGDSSYIKNLIFVGDTLGLRAAANYSDTTGFGVEGRVISGDLNGSYQTVVGFSANANYRIENYPKELLLDRQLFSGQIQYATYLITNLNMVASARGTLEDNRYRADVGVVEESLTLNYLIGKLRMGLQYQQIETLTSGDRYGTRAILAQATRTF
jgi:hypothetical protein